MLAELMQLVDQAQRQFGSLDDETGSSLLNLPTGGSTDAGAGATGASPGGILTANGVINDYLVVFMVAFLVTLIVTPLVRRIALKARIVDWPDQGRKVHREPVAYLGGVAVFAGLLSGIMTSYITALYHPTLATVPLNIVIAMAIIMFTGLFDDVFHWDPNLKVGLQFTAAAVLALDEQIGGRVAAGLLHPVEEFMNGAMGLAVNLSRLDIMPGSGSVEIDLVYWTGAIIIGAFVIGGCNAANLIDGLDGLLTGTTAIMAASLLVITLVVAAMFPHMAGQLTGTRVILCFALLGAALGFLPHNFRPASIFLGDAGSLLVGFTVIVIILLLGETGYTHLVFAGLIVFGLPILDTTLAIIRRRLNGMPISAPDDNHLHHMLKRTKLGVVGAVFVLYAISIAFSSVALLLVLLRARVVYALVIVMAGFIVVIGVKAARRKQQMADLDGLTIPRSRRAGGSVERIAPRPAPRAAPERSATLAAAESPGTEAV
ncbi:MAG: undecaprenyl/decaprenyl-phosphate alpha-N-acetylglucosaminyl 1-phosphate transferase [Phycisphaerales bacterium]|nr:undecaprenyl/decaprenyl-phosphate alpha-N-acetylglucosaminyl 1-phosphate transferase [Phycisphaerales bacterium]